MTIAEVNVETFDAVDYIEARAGIDPFTMVEIGHGHHPVVGRQPHAFTGQSAYIGIEADMRYHTAPTSTAAYRMLPDGTERNIVFLKHQVGGKMVQRELGTTDEEYRGEFYPETILPAGIADEVVLSNVFCDPAIGACPARTLSLLEEVSRLLDVNGTAVLRETISPYEVNPLGFLALGSTGLKVLQKVTPYNRTTWDSLEALYGTTNHIEPGSYYMLLGKVAAC